jgi:KAP family P-loop domain
MGLDFINQRVTSAALITLLKVGFIGVFSGEAWYLGQAAAKPISAFVNLNNLVNSALVTGAVIVVLLFIYGYCRNFHRQVTQVVSSTRFDLLLLFLLGLVISFSFNGIGSAWYEKGVAFLTLFQLTLLILVPVVMGFVLTVRATLSQYTNNRESYAPFFISDVEKQNKDDDLLGFADKAERFAERVFNGGSPDSIVFGIDAPWGIGKSTFVNFCQEYWENKHKSDIIIYKFNPLRYEDRLNLLEKFVDGLVQSIQKQTFVPEIRPLISRYSRFIKGKGTLSIPGLDLEVMPGSYTVDDAFDDLEAALKDLDKKILIVVDDLDRLNFSAIKDVLFVIKKSFTLPNISYVLCYDTDNITALEKEHIDPDKVTEFLEKFVNVKVSLYLDNETLSKYVSENLAKSLTGNSQADPILVSTAMGGLIDIFKSQEYHRYLPFIGDVRKLKRLINTLMFLELEHTDFDNSDFDKQDLIHLLLIYINYPSIFRKIYNTETRGKRGFFSLVVPHDDYYPPLENGQQRDRYGENGYKNSTLYTTYTEKLDENPRFLIDQIFKVANLLEDARIDSVSEEMKHTRACFNGGWTNGRNLESYLNLIVNLSKPQKGDQYRFYLNAKDQIKQGTPLEEVLSREEFVTSNNENSHKQLWRVVTNSLFDFSPQVGTHLINYLKDNITRYSLFTLDTIGVGLRDDLDYFLVKVLDTVGWSDEAGEHRNNTPENIGEIAEWIFGDGRHIGNGILDTLFNSERGVMGLYDLVAFRLFCSADRAGSVFNLTRSIALHANPSAPTDGDMRIVVIEEMREVSQKVFSMFREQYINPRKDLFDEIDALTISDLAGDWSDYVAAKITDGEITQAEVDKILMGMRSRMKLFISYQLGNTEINHGVGCGFYDETGKVDAKGIAEALNVYMFDVCFDPAGGLVKYEHFIDYLLINFASVFASIHGGRSYIPHINEFTKVLNRQRLAQYWRDNATKIRALDLPKRVKLVETVNYTASYDELEEVYDILDQLVLDEDTAVIKVEILDETEVLEKE